MKFYLIFILLILLLCNSNTVSAIQQSPDSSSFSIPIIPNNSKIDSEKVVIVSKITIKGNEKTREKIVLRELTFNQNDTIILSTLDKQLVKSRINLLKTSLFNYVTCKIQLISGEHVEVQIVLEERWYIWPYIIFQYADRNFSAWLQHKDINRLNYGLGAQIQNMRGRNEILKINALMGYNQILALSYYNLYLDKARKHSLWFDLSYMRQNQIGYQTINNKLDYVKIENKYLIHTQQAGGSYNYRPQLFNTHIVDIRYNICEISDSIALINSDFLGDSRTKMNYFTFKYEFRRDLRDSKIYPLQGYYFSAQLNSIAIDSKLSNSIYNIKSSLKKYFGLANRLYGAISMTGKMSSNSHQPFYFQQGLGYKENLHGYEYYVIDGQHFLLNQNIIKFELVPTKIVFVKFLPFHEFNKIHYAIYLNAYFDNAFVWDNSKQNKIFNNTLANSFLYSEGVGLDFVTYYDRVLRFEYSMNKQREKGIFIHFKTPF